MKKMFGFLLAIMVIVWAAPVLRLALGVSLFLGWLLWKQCSKTLTTQRKLRPVRIPVVSRKK